MGICAHMRATLVDALCEHPTAWWDTAITEAVQFLGQ